MRRSAFVTLLFAGAGILACTAVYQDGDFGEPGEGSDKETKLAGGANPGAGGMNSSSGGDEQGGTGGAGSGGAGSGGTTSTGGGPYVLLNQRVGNPVHILKSASGKKYQVHGMFHSYQVYNASPLLKSTSFQLAPPVQ